MVEADCVYSVEQPQVIFVRIIISVPSHDIKRRTIYAGAPQFPLKFGQQFELASLVFEGRPRGQEIPWICQSICANRSQMRKAKRRSVVLADVTAGGTIW